MQVLKRKILLENSTDRTYNSPNWGVMTADTFYINVFLTQNIDDMGLFFDIEYIPTSQTTYTQPDYSILTNKLSLSGITFPFMTGIMPANVVGISDTEAIVIRKTGDTESNYYNFGNSPITGVTDSKIEDLRSYKASNPFRVGFDMFREDYINHNNVLVNGHGRVVSVGEPNIYAFDAITGTTIGTVNQPYGIQYHDYTGQTINITIDGKTSTVPKTTFRFIGQGLNETNVSLSALTKEEYLFGIISVPEVETDVFIDRGITTVMELHLKMSEIKNLGELGRYGNGFYNLTIQ